MVHECDFTRGLLGNHAADQPGRGRGEAGRRRTGHRRGRPRPVRLLHLGRHRRPRPGRQPGEQDRSIPVGKPKPAARTEAARATRRARRMAARTKRPATRGQKRSEEKATLGEPGRSSVRLCPRTRTASGCSSACGPTPTSPSIDLEKNEVVEAAADRSAPDRDGRRSEREGPVRRVRQLDAGERVRPGVRSSRFRRSTAPCTRSAPSGNTPNSLTLLPDSVLLVANADANNLSAFNVADPRRRPTPLGFIPTGWYPTAVRYNPADRRIYVANGKGLSSKPNRYGPNPMQPGRGA